MQKQYMSFLIVALVVVTALLGASLYKWSMVERDIIPKRAVSLLPDSPSIPPPPDIKEGSTSGGAVRTKMVWAKLTEEEILNSALTGVYTSGLYLQNELLYAGKSSEFNLCDYSESQDARDRYCENAPERTGKVELSDVTILSSPVTTITGRPLETFAVATLYEANQVREKKIHWLNTHRFTITGGNSIPSTGISLSELSFPLPLDAQVKEIASGDGETLTILYSRAGQKVTEIHLAIEPIRHGAGRFVELVKGGTEKVYSTPYRDYEFNYPAEFNISTYFSSMSRVPPSLEEYAGASPLYFSESCGFEPTFSDEGEMLSVRDPDAGTRGVSAHLMAHHLGAPITYLTSARYGYDSAEWGKVKERIVMASYIQDIQSGASVEGKNIEMLEIDEKKVRHILPYALGRPCDNKRFDQYQWVHDGMLLNLTFTEGEALSIKEEVKQHLIYTVISTMKKSN